MAEIDALWDTRDVARYLRRSPRTVRRWLAALPDLPRTRITPRGPYLYDAAAIREWVRRHGAGPADTPAPMPETPPRRGRPRRQVAP